MTVVHRIGPKGQVVIPKPLRDALGLEPGDAVEFQLVDGKAVQIEPARDWRALRGAFAGRGLVETLEAEHRAELERERG